jgi:hypothetical protein
VPVTVGGHFERVAAIYELLRTTDEAPVRTISQLLPGRRITGLDIGCGTGRYTRLLRAVLPHGSPGTSPHGPMRERVTGLATSTTRIGTRRPPRYPRH